jgi:hypothetical protein
MMKTFDSLQIGQKIRGRISISTESSPCMGSSHSNPTHVPTSFRLALDNRGQKENLSDANHLFSLLSFLDIVNA